nr:MAG TPA: hypothetical protein [Caudoviricetes sp.]
MNQKKKLNKTKALSENTDKAFLSGLFLFTLKAWILNPSSKKHSRPKSF